MLHNAGKKIALAAQIILIAGIALSVIAGIFIIVRGSISGPLRISYYNSAYLYRTGMMHGGRFIATGLLVMIFGSLSSWLWALLLRAFGDMADNSRVIRERLESTSSVIAEVEPPATSAEDVPAQAVNEETSAQALEEPDEQ